jgi:hypothetical protein
MLGWGCASPGPGGGYRWFGRPGAADPWSYPISSWQARQAAEPGRKVAGPAPPPASIDEGGGPRVEETPLRRRYDGFLAERRRLLAREVLLWVQEQARTRYRDDGEVDFWPTLEETLDAGQEDCDGLELLTYHALQALGFGEWELYRAILAHERFQMHHMVTLWFEDPADPWVLDPTGTITTPMSRMSEIDLWRPVKLFTESVEYTVTPRR